MGLRTDPQYVRDILKENYDSERNTDLMPFVRSAEVLTNQVVACATRKRVVGLDTLTLKEIESYLACHFYCIQDPLYKSRSTQGASGAFQTGPGGMEMTDYLTMAITLDPSGCLNALVKRQRAGGFYLGKRHPERDLDEGCGTGDDD
jgi:hypothetical protein